MFATLMLIYGVVCSAQQFNSEIELDQRTDALQPVAYSVEINIEDDAYVPAVLIQQIGNPKTVKLRSHSAYIYDERDGQALLGRYENKQVPIASLTKIMTAMVVLDAKLPLTDWIMITKADKDTVRYARSRLPFGTTLTRYDLIKFALVASENRAASALARTFPGGRLAFIKAMNAKAKLMGLENTSFTDASGLRNGNVSTARELSEIVKEASNYPLIESFSTMTAGDVIDVKTGRMIKFNNTNKLVRNDNWDISLSKTGFTNDAGNCLVMRTVIGDRPLIMVFLNSWGKLSKYGDSNRVKSWLLQTEKKIKRQYFL